MLMRKNDNTNDIVSLLKRLAARFHNPKIVKMVLGLILAESIAFSGAACDMSTTPPNNETSVSTNQNGEIVTESNSQDDPNQGNTSSSTKYSQLWHNVITNQEYIDLIRRAKYLPSLFESAKFDPHPYTFLEDEGHNVEAIKNGELNCFTRSYILHDEPNNLYIATTLESESKTFYYQYLLRFKLSDQEKQDYLDAHLNDQNQFHIEAVFLNDELCKLRDPEVLSETQITIDAYNNMKKSFASVEESLKLGSKIYNVILTDANEEQNRFNICILPERSMYDHMTYSATIATCKLRGHRGHVRVDGDVFVGPYEFGQFEFTSEEDCLVKQSASCFNSQFTDLTERYATTTVE